MQICGITSTISASAEGTAVAFLLVQNGGYLVAFTAGGQTLGKMAPASASCSRIAPRIALGHAFPADADVGRAGRAGGPRLPHRALQPRSIAASTIRFAGTRVVRASA
jgi:hypothetical protein